MKRDLSGTDVIKVLVTEGAFRWERTSGDHAVLRWEHPSGLETRTVTVPLHGRLSVGTIGHVAEQAGTDDVDTFCTWVGRNR